MREGMKKKLIKPMILITGTVLLGSMAYSAINQRFSAKGETTYLFSPIKRGTIERTVSSTGTLNALGTVVIGAQVSGIVDKVLVDYNDTVSQGEVLATLDTAIFESAEEKAKAEIQRANAEYKLAESEFRRYQKLFKKGHIAEQEFRQYQTNMEISQAAVRAAEAVLKKESANLTYAVIKSPIDGTVIERNVEAGQTITSNLSTPTLFIIAADLSKMQIEVDVDESDIGQILPDQSVRFNVQAYPDKVFYGKVRQIRLNPSMVQNVVNYKVIVSANNESGFLLPGMTTMVDFIVEKKDDVLLISNEAIRFKPPQEILNSLPDSLLTSFPQPEEDEFGPGRTIRLFYMNANDELGILSAKAGISDEEYTELVPPESYNQRLQEDMLVISGIDAGESKNEKGFSLFPNSNKKIRRGPF
jgi:HlyD family secretion protein